jgi:DNA-binding transcriptional ArsR family regulator
VKPHDVDLTLEALADPARRSAIELLRKKPCRAGELAQALALSAPSMSRHLRILRKSGLVEEDGIDNDARVRLYRLRAEPFRALRDWLAEVETFWGVELASFKAHAERTRKARR